MLTIDDTVRVAKRAFVPHHWDEKQRNLIGKEIIIRGCTIGHRTTYHAEGYIWNGWDLESDTKTIPLNPMSELAINLMKLIQSGVNVTLITHIMILLHSSGVITTEEYGRLYEEIVENL